VASNAGLNHLPAEHQPRQQWRFFLLLIRALASGKPTSNKTHTTSNDCSLKLPNQSPMAPCHAVEPETSTDSHNQQNHQASLSEVLHFPSRAATRASRAANRSSKGSAAPVSMNCAQAI